MAKKIQRNYNVPDACFDLDYVGKMSVVNGGFDDESGKTMVTLLVRQKRKNPSELKSDADFATYSLKKLGFKDISKDGTDGTLAIADIVVEYDISKKPYTITKADSKELKSLKDVIDYSGAKIIVSRDEPTIQKVRPAEFKQAIANYLAQHQM